MMYNYLPALIVVLSLCAFLLGRYRAISVSTAAGGKRILHSLPSHYGVMTAMAGILPALLIYGIWAAVETPVLDTRIMNEFSSSLASEEGARRSLVLNDIKNTIDGNVSLVSNDSVKEAADRYQEIRQTYRNVVSAAVFAVIAVLSLVAYRLIAPSLRARNIVEAVIRAALMICSGVAILTTLGIVFSVLFEAIRFFRIVPLQDFLFGLNWSPQMAIRPDQAGSSGAFGAVPIFTGTFMIAGIAMAVAIPIGLLSAIYLSEYADTRFRAIVSPCSRFSPASPRLSMDFSQP